MAEQKEKEQQELMTEESESNEVQEEKIVTAQGLDAEQYDVSKPWVEGEKVEEEDELHGVLIQYNLKADEVKKALKAFQKKTIFKKNLIYTILLVVFFLLYLQTLVKDPANTMAKILAPLCVAIIGFIWYLPARHVKATAQAVEMVHENFHIEVCDEGILLDEKNGKYLIAYNKPTTKCMDLTDIFVICVSQKQMFAVPKRCIPAEQLNEVTKLLKDGLREKYEIIE